MDSGLGQVISVLNPLQRTEKFSLPVLGWLLLWLSVGLDLLNFEKDDGIGEDVNGLYGEW